MVNPSAVPSRLLARPREDCGSHVASGLYELPDGALLRVPTAVATRERCALFVLFHGAGSTAAAGQALLAERVEDPKAIVLAPQSAGSTWDVIEGGFGADVRRLDRALTAVFNTCSVDPSRVVFGGFSDGASYALSLGIDNGDLARHLVAFSPGFAAPVAPRGQPRIIVTHGIHDPVLPVGRCSRRLVPRLRDAGYDGPMRSSRAVTSSPRIIRRAIRWLDGR